MNRSPKDEFLEAYNKLSDPIFRHCYFRISNRERAKELMQEVFIKAWEYILNNNSSIKNMKALIYKIANNLIIDEYRKKKTISLDELSDNTGFDPGYDNREQVDKTLDGKDILKLLGKIDEKYREVITMRYIDELSPKEIASLLNESENNISVRINRGIKKIRQILKGNE